MCHLGGLNLSRLGRAQLRSQNRVRVRSRSPHSSVETCENWRSEGGGTNKLSAEVKQGRFARLGTRGKRAEADKVSVGDI